MSVFCKLFGHNWTKWNQFSRKLWHRYCMRCQRTQVGGRGKKPNYKGLKII